MLSKKAHLILPTHRLIDAASEASKGNNKIGSTLKGIGPTYMDKTGRNGLRIGDISEKDFMEKYHALVEKHSAILSWYNQDSSALKQMEEDWFKGIEILSSLPQIDSEHFINEKLKNGNSVLAEGAQGSLLDIDFGTYPFVTSSNTICAGACTGLGIPPTKIGEVYGIFKAYCTRVGSGPFPTELTDNTGEEMRKKGNEFGSTTGRARRCGWLDLPALKYAIMLNGATKLIMMKADVLSIFQQLKVCTHYNYKGKKIDYFPYDITDKNVSPVYKELKGWNQDITKLNNIDELPAELNDYIQFIEEQVEVPVTIVSVGPDRTQTLIREKAFA
jgi:adenylosuccinate synthase